MKMRKWTTLLLAATILLAALTGCGSPAASDTTGDIGGHVSPLESTSGNGDISGEITPSDPTDSSDPTSSSDPTDSSDPTNSTDNSLSLGRMEGGTYTNKYIGISCTLDETWVYSSAEELQELPDNVNEMFEGSELSDALKDMEQIIDMKAESVQELATMNINYQKLTMTQRLAYATMTEEQIIDTVLSQKDLMEDAYATAGINVTSMEKKTVTFLGEERTGIYTVGETMGIAYYIMQIQFYDLGQYSATLTVASYIEDKTADLLALFTAI